MNSKAGPVSKPAYIPFPIKRKGRLLKCAGQPKDTGSGDAAAYASRPGGSGTGESGSGGTGGNMSLLRLPPEKANHMLPAYCGTGDKDNSLF